MNSYKWIKFKEICLFNDYNNNNNDDWQRDLSVHDVDYEPFDSILYLNRSQKSLEISIYQRDQWVFSSITWWHCWYDEDVSIY